MENLAVIPVSVKKARLVRIKRGQMTFLTPGETLAILKTARQHSTRDWAMILVAYRHGLRASEVCGLKLADIDVKAGSISVRRLKGSLQTTQPLYQHRGQPLLDEVSALRSWLRKRPATAQITCLPARREESWDGLSSSVTFRRLLRVLACRSKSGTLTSSSTRWHRTSSQET